MHAIRLLHKRMKNALPEIHAIRLQSLFAAVGGLLRGQQLWLTAVGRHLQGRPAEQHKIKRIDRLLGNRQLGVERRTIYGWLCRLVIGRCPHPCILVDWSDVDAARTRFILRAAVGGRALPVYEEVHTRYHHPTDTRRFLQRLAQQLPTGCVPVIVTDAGFRGPWFAAVEAMGWYYVGRVRNRDHVCMAGSDAWIAAKTLYQQARSCPQALGAVWFRRSAPWRTCAYLYRMPRRGRKRLTVHGTARRNAASLKHAEREREPWLLVSNLPAQRLSAKRVVAIYRHRMSIEQGFRDLKAYRHGFAFRGNLGRDPERLANLLLIAALASVCTWLIGLVGIARGTARTLQANTERQKRVLSVFFIGSRLLYQRLKITHQELCRALDHLQHTVAQNAGIMA